MPCSTLPSHRPPRRRPSWSRIAGVRPSDVTAGTLSRAAAAAVVRTMWTWLVVAVFVFGSPPARAQDNDGHQNFTSYFADCKRGEDGFDDCIKKALNDVRPWFKTGVPDLKIPPFDPFFAKEVVQKRGVFALNYRLVLRNVQERGWTQSEVTSFRSDPVLNLVQYTQFFPEKYLEGEYETSGQVLITPPDNRGVWNMTLYNLVQTTTISRPRGAERLKVRVDVQKIGNMDLHISNLLRGRAFMENVLDRIINASWRAGFPVVRPLINDLVSTAFTEIFNNAFNELDVDQVLPP